MQYNKVSIILMMHDMHCINMLTLYWYNQLGPCMFYALFYRLKSLKNNLIWTQKLGDWSLQLRITIWTYIYICVCDDDL